VGGQRASVIREAVAANLAEREEWLGSLFRFMSFTGLRASEIAGLRRETRPGSASSAIALNARPPLQDSVASAIG
jgi:hypothetical protein